ncbi:Blp family class II bacteriocin [Brevundimonas sp.]|uniref:Blp family class II bacteriocin n=1 Tax=Brevundimonas sp. TaxID=1871086 RepID=UPI002FCB4CC0
MTASVDMRELNLDEIDLVSGGDGDMKDAFLIGAGLGGTLGGIIGGPVGIAVGGLTGGAIAVLIYKMD